MNESKTTNDELRAEIESLKRQLAEQKKLLEAEHHRQPKSPSAGALVAIAVVLAALIVGGFFAGYLPRQRREQVLAAESREETQALPVVNVARVERSATRSNLVLPGNIQAVTEAPILARTSGYLRKRNVDIGDRVKAGQVLAEIEAPELQQQINQSKAAVDQSQSTVQQAQAALKQGQANAELSRITHVRWDNLFKKGVVSRQENDTYMAQYEAQQANVQALEKAVAAARSNAAAAEANLARLNELLGYQKVRAPFDGVITLRNVDVGALVNDGSTLLFRIAQPDRLRTYLNVPQVDAPSVRPGQQATLTIPDLPGRRFTGAVTRTASALDPATRTLLVEVQVANGGGALLPGMYAQVDLSVPRKDPPLVIPGDTLVVRSDGPQVATVAADGSVHFARIQLGRDFGNRLEVLSGLELGQQLVVNPSDAVREGAKVKPTAAPEKAAPGKRP